MIFISNLNYAGLGNRINTLVSDIMLFNTIHNDSKHVVYWPIIKDKFEDLFEPIKDIQIVTSIDKSIKYKFDTKICDNDEYSRNPNGFIMMKNDYEKIKQIESYY